MKRRHYCGAKIGSVVTRRLLVTTAGLTLCAFAWATEAVAQVTPDPPTTAANRPAIPVVAPSVPTAVVQANATSSLAALELARRSVEKYFSQATNVVCKEAVSQEIIGKNGKTAYWEESIFEYQLQGNTNSGSLKLVESRDARKSSFRDPSRVLLITSGFTSMLLIVHPDYEVSYTFEPAGEETEQGVPLVKINFKPVPGGASPAALQLRGQNYPVPLSGTLWIDPRSGAIAKLIAGVDSSLSDLGLQGMRSEIRYATIAFHDPDEAYWMPVSAVIDVETPRQHWRNTHRFADYRRFRATIHVGFENKP